MTVGRGAPGVSELGINRGRQHEFWFGLSLLGQALLLRYCLSRQQEADRG
jgi:hypothetical protein